MSNYMFLSANLFKFVSINSNSFLVGVIWSIAVSGPTLNKPSPIVHVTKKFASPSLNLNTSYRYCISDLSCAKKSLVSDDVRTACASGFS